MSLPGLCCCRVITQSGGGWSNYGHNQWARTGRGASVGEEWWISVMEITFAKRYQSIGVDNGIVSMSWVIFQSENKQLWIIIAVINPAREIHPCNRAGTLAFVIDEWPLYSSACSSLPMSQCSPLIGVGLAVLCADAIASQLRSQHDYSQECCQYSSTCTTTST